MDSSVGTSPIPPAVYGFRSSRLLPWVVSSFQPAILIEMIDHEPSGKETSGQAIMWISRNEHGVMEASGTFKTAGAPLTGGEQLQGRMFQYEGPAYEAGKAYEIRTVVFVVSVQGDLYELEALTEPVVVHKVDEADEPAALPDLIEYPAD